MLAADRGIDPGDGGMWYGDKEGCSMAILAVLQE
jgi:hypothetical protein